MHIKLNTDNNIDGREELATRVRGAVQSALGRFSDRITSVEVHLSEHNSDRRGQRDKRCMMEARLEGRHPTAVAHLGASVHDAVDGAADKLKRLIESSVERAKPVARTW